MDGWLVGSVYMAKLKQTENKSRSKCCWCLVVRFFILPYFLETHWNKFSLSRFLSFSFSSSAPPPCIPQWVSIYKQNQNWLLQIKFGLWKCSREYHTVAALLFTPQAKLVYFLFELFSQSLLSSAFNLRSNSKMWLSSSVQTIYAYKFSFSLAFFFVHIRCCIHDTFLYFFFIRLANQPKKSEKLKTAYGISNEQQQKEKRNIENCGKLGNLESGQMI